MKKGILISAVILLSACGGGSGSSDVEPTPTPPPPPPPNSAPTLTGQLVLSIDANTTGDLVLNVQDDDDDTISASLPNNESWVTVSVDGNQLTVSAAPTLFNAGNQSVALSLSDGQEETNYTLSINVDSPESSYNFIEANEQIVVGNWSLSDGRTMIFEENRGLLKNAEADYTPFEWKIFDGELELSFYPFGCFKNCALEDYVELFIVDENDNGEYVFALEGDNLARQLAIASPINNTPAKAGAYSAISRHSTTIIDTDLAPENTQIVLDMYLDDRETQQNFTATVDLSVDENDNIVFNSLAENAAPPMVSLNFTNNDDNFVNIDIRVNFESFELVSVDDSLVQIKSKVSFSLVDETQLNGEISDFTGLRDFLDSSTFVYGYYSRLTKSSFSAFSEGDVLYFRNYIEHEALPERSSVGKLVFNSANEANWIIDILDPLMQSELVIPAEVEISSGNMILTVDDIPATYKKYLNEFGNEVVIYPFERNGTTAAFGGMLFTPEIGNDEITQEALTKTWQLESFIHVFDTFPEYMSFDGSGMMDRSHSYADTPNYTEFYQISEQRNIDILRPFACQNAQNYQECDAQNIDDLIANDLPGDVVFRERFEVIELSSTQLTVLRTMWYKIEDLHIILSSPRRYQLAEQ